MNTVKEQINIYPLGIFSKKIVEELPYLNMSNNLSKIEELYKYLPSNEQLNELLKDEKYNTSVIAMGDLGIFLVSLKRCKSKIDTTLLEKLLLLCSDFTGLPPRDTYSSYITYNPSNAMRTFTKDSSEIGFIEQHKFSDEAMNRAVELLLEVQNGMYDDLEFKLQLADEAISKLTNENKLVHQRVNPTYFIKYFRDYFFPIDIEDTTYDAPSGVHIANIILLDIAIGTADEHYKNTANKLISYLEPYDKFRIRIAMEETSIKEKFLDNSIKFNLKQLNLIKSIYRKLRIYRYVHQGLVTRYIRNQDPEVTKGTGGFPFDTFLQERIDIVEKAEEDVKRAFMHLDENYFEKKN